MWKGPLRLGVKMDSTPMDLVRRRAVVIHLEFHESASI